MWPLFFLSIYDRKYWMRMREWRLLLQSIPLYLLLDTWLMITTDNGLFLSLPPLAPQRAAHFIVYTTICLFERNKLPFVCFNHKRSCSSLWRALFHWTTLILLLGSILDARFHLTVIMNNSPRNNDFLLVMLTHNFVRDVYLIFLSTFPM